MNLRNRFRHCVTAIVAALSFLVCALPAETPLQVDWSRQIGTASGDGDSGVATDGMGNVYISGHTGGLLSGQHFGGSDAFLTKFDASGVLLWSRQVGTVGEDEGHGVSADGLGNVYISGSTGGPLGGPFLGGRYDAFVTKFDAAGTVLWSRQLGTAGASDSAYGVSADGMGNVYISGETHGSLSGPQAGFGDAFLSKFDADGVLQWTRQIGTTEGDDSQSVSADSFENVYICGSTDGSLSGPNAGGADAFLSKFDADGVLQWTRQVGTGVSDSCNSVTVDQGGDVYIAGYTDGAMDGTNSGDRDVILSKFDASGEMKWTRQFGTPLTDVAFAVSADSLGNVFVSGYSGGSSIASQDALVLKYDADGGLLWSQHFASANASEVSHGVAADGFGNVYFSGQTSGAFAGPSAGSYDAFLVHLAPAPIPEPSSLILAAVGFCALAAARCLPTQVKSQ